MWRGSLLPLDCAAVAQATDTGSASHSSGSKLPRHRAFAAVRPRLGIEPKACPRQVDNPASIVFGDLHPRPSPFSTEGLYVFHQSPRRFTFASAVYLAQRQADGDQPAESQ
ncbi:hypothetical protein F7R05_25110 [Pseudomonas koreensis]|nr:hypothetical protein F7R05_25110 [Pseudomonas koreensis]